MINKDEIYEWLKNNLTLALIIGFSLLLLFISSIFLIVKNNYKDNQETVTTISFVDGQNEIIVDRKTGKVTIKTPTGIFTQYWDEDKIKSFFENLDNLDFEGLSQYIGTSLAIELTLSNGEKIVVNINEVGEENIEVLEKAIAETYQDVKYNSNIDSSGDTNNSNYFNNDEDNPVSDNNSSSNSDPWKTGNEIQDTTTLKCNEVDPVTGKRVVISNTVCAQ